MVTHPEASVLHVFHLKRIPALCYSSPFYYVAKYMRGTWPCMGHYSSALQSQTWEHKWVSNPILTKGIWWQVCWEIHKVLYFMSKLWKLLFFLPVCGHLLLGVGGCICWIHLAPSWRSHYTGSRMELRGLWGTWPEPLDSAFSEVHLTSEFPAIQANHFLNVESIVSFLLLVTESMLNDTKIFWMCAHEYVHEVITT